jgi:hypothetical protein
MSPSFLVYLAQTQFSKSHYKQDIESLQLSHMASGTSFQSLDDLCWGLEHLNRPRGLSYGGGAAPMAKGTPPIKTTTLAPPPPK